MYHLKGESGVLLSDRNSGLKRNSANLEALHTRGHFNSQASTSKTFNMFYFDLECFSETDKMKCGPRT
jgi:hypothetical protein